MYAALFHIVVYAVLFHIVSDVPRLGIDVSAVSLLGGAVCLFFQVR